MIYFCIHPFLFEHIEHSLIPADLQISVLIFSFIQKIPFNLFRNVSATFSLKLNGASRRIDVIELSSPDPFLDKLCSYE